MKSTSVWAFALSCAPAVFAQATTTTDASATTTSPEPSCTASLVTTLCDYPDPELAVASSGKEHCWGYCNKNQPCDFVIFRQGNPYTGTGTCWLYPGKTFDASAGSTSGCSNPYLSVYSKPTCSGGSPTTGGCAATASPSAVAEVCNYPAPEDCFYTCYASSGAGNCLDICAKADSCAYAVFNPRTESLSPYSSGTCWVYTNGTFDPSAATTCSGKTEQYVYNNACPKAISPSPSAAAIFSGASAVPSATVATAPRGDAEAQNASETPKAVAKDSGSSRFAPNLFLAAGLAAFLH